MRCSLPLIASALVLSPILWAAGFPKPEPEKAFAELKVYDGAGHPWRAAKEDWTGAKQRVASDPEWAAWLKREQADVDAWIARHRDHVEWAAGWSHDGVSPKDGSRVAWVDKIPRQEITYFTTPSDPHIEITDKLFAWWVVTFRGHHVDTMVRAAALYRLTGDDRYAAWASSQLALYADNLDKWAVLPSAKGARLFWQTLTEASNLVKFVEVVRLLGDYVPPERRQQWRTQFFDPEVKLLNATHHDIHNIATWQRCAAAQVALLFGDEAAWRQEIDGEFGLRQQMAEGITSDYLWYEQSLGYNNFVVSAVRTLFTMAGLYGRAAELAPEMATAENLMLAPTYVRFPNGQLPNPADSNGIPTAPNRAFFGENYRIFPTAIGLAEIAGRRDWNTLLDPPKAIQAGLGSSGAAGVSAESLPAVTSRNLESTRMAVLRSGPWQVFLHYGQLTRSHIQAEALNYSAFYGTTDITHDPGTVGYGSPLHKGYYTQGLNHNVPLIDGEAETPPQRGELLAYSAQSATVSAAQPHYRDNARATRTLHLEQNRLIDTATIESTAGAKKLGLALHLEGKPTLPIAFVADATFAAHRPSAFGYWRNVSVATFRDRAEFDVTYGSTVMHVTLAAPGEFKLWHGSAPDVPPKRRDSFYLELTAPASSATFTTTFEPQPPPSVTLNP
jgi:oligo-alginate lyase